MTDSPAANSAAEEAQTAQPQPNKKPTPTTTTVSEPSASEKDGSNKGAEENSSATTTDILIVDEKSVKKEEDGVVKSEGDGDATEEEEDIDIVYPGGLPLALLTFGLCMANLAVALGTYFFFSFLGWLVKELGKPVSIDMGIHQMVLRTNSIQITQSSRQQFQKSPRSFPIL